MMEDISVLQKSGIIIDRKVRTNCNETILYQKRTLTNPVIENLIAERGENFSLYLDWLGLADDPNLMVLS